MFVYAVIIELDEELSDRFEDYMRSKHIPDVLATGKFNGASIARSEEGVYRISYLAPNRESLEDYLAKDTKRLRELFMEEFPFDVSASREVLEVIDVWSPDQS